MCYSELSHFTIVYYKHFTFKQKLAYANYFFREMIQNILLLKSCELIWLPYRLVIPNIKYYTSPVFLFY